MVDEEFEKLNSLHKDSSKGADTEALLGESEDENEKGKEFDVMDSLADIDDLPDYYFSEPEDP